MANGDNVITHLSPVIRFPRSKIEGAVPDPDNVEEGEINLNLKDRTIFSKDGDQVVKVGANYDDILVAHFNARNPHGTRPEDLGLGNVPNTDLRPLYYFDPPDTVFNISKAQTIVEYVSSRSVFYQIESNAYDVGDCIDFSRISRNAGRMTIRLLNNARWLDNGSPQNRDLITSGFTRLSVVLRKAGEDIWTTRVSFV